MSAYRLAALRTAVICIRIEAVVRTIVRARCLFARCERLAGFFANWFAYEWTATRTAISA